MKFSLGRVVGTPGAEDLCREHGVRMAALLNRHRAGDWGDLDADDKAINDAALVDGDRILSSYNIAPGHRVWIITEAVGEDGKREATTFLLPDEY